ncbi:MAG: 50S ribosomal protein L23 [Candidatus Wildermuthbacteria bacterium]|nr:50S ribosomal protein L23 [Candidatus Wildermuthbacteria bacterium]
MGFNIFKKAKKEEKKIESPKAEQKKEALKQVSVSRKGVDSSFRVFMNSVITEKASNLAAMNTYTFKVYPGTSKGAVKKAVKDLYGVDAVKVNMVNIHSKEIRVGKTRGIKQGFRKAVVKVKEGQKIEMMSA